MPVEFKNYYDVLGVARNASDAEIKKSFRKLARKYHPDVAKDKTTAEDKFKELNEANEVLSDPEKRRKYDELGANWNHPERQPAPSQRGSNGSPEDGSEFHFEGTGFSDFFEQFFGSRGRAAGGFGQTHGAETFARRGQDIERHSGRVGRSPARFDAHDKTGTVRSGHREIDNADLAGENSSRRT